MSSVQFTPNILFDDNEQFKKVIMIYGKHVFNSTRVDDNMLNFIYDNFIKTDFLENGKILGSLTGAETSRLTTKEYKAVVRQRDICKKFFELFIINFNDQNMKIPSSTDKPIGEGTYGSLFPYIENGIESKNKIVKYVSKAQSTGIRNYEVDVATCTK